MSATSSWESEPATTGSVYYLRSSVTGNVIVEYNSNGAKTMASVYAGGEVLAQEMPAYPSGTQVLWQHNNPVVGDAVATNSTGVAGQRATVDPTGINAGDSDPAALPPGFGDGIDPSQSMIDSMVAQMIPGWGGPKCYVNGSLTGCWFAASASGDGFERYRPTATFLRFRNPDTGEVRRIAAFYRPLPGGGGYGYVPIRQSGITFDGNFVRAAWADGAVGLGVLRPEQDGGMFHNSWLLSQQAKGPKIDPLIPQNLRQLVSDLANRKACADIMSKFFSVLAKNAKSDPGKTLVETTFDNLKEIVVDDEKAGSGAMTNGSTIWVRGYQQLGETCERLFTRQMFLANFYTASVKGAVFVVTTI